MAFRILVVDDYPDAVTAVCMLLRMLGHDTRSAVTGRSALDEARVFEPHVVVLDIGLPDISGYDVARELRKHGRPMYLAAVTGWGESSHRLRAIEAGFDQHVVKPSDARKLRQIIEGAQRTIGTGR